MCREAFFSKLKETFNGVRIKIRIEYEDEAHVPYETGICMGNLQACGYNRGEAGRPT